MRRVLVAAGLLLMGYAVVGGVTDDDVRPVGVVVFLGGVLLAHDAVLMPLAIGAGVLIGRFVPASGRAAVRAAALCSLAVTLVAVPLILGAGRIAGDPSASPQRFGRGLLVVLSLVWAPALAAVAVRRWRRPRAVSNPKAREGHDPRALR